MANVLDYAFRPTLNSICYGNPDVTAKSAIEGVVLTTISCNPLTGGIFLAAELFGNIYSGFSTGQNCNDAFGPDLNNVFNVFAVQSSDPNAKYGSTGIYNSPYINSSSDINYNIHFENVDTATAPAQKVIIRDTLNRMNLDLSTFKLQQISFGDTSITVPYGVKAYTADIDLRPKIDLIVRIASYLNDSTGVAIWNLTSLDPTTMNPTTNPLIGFLPPNDSTGRGEASVSYSIKAIGNTSSGTIINNKADIYFDYNEPIATHTWANIIDDLKPKSKVDALPDVTNTDSFFVNWSGSDNGPAGVYAYNVYYKVNDGEWISWKYNTSETNGAFVGMNDSTYSFYSVAIDSALNIEDAPNIADAVTTISSDVLAVSLVSFNANCSSNTVQLTWLTANESDIKYFTIEKSTNGANWISVKKLISPKNNQGQNQYRFSESYDGYNYYRIAITNTDGSMKYSSIIKINCGKIINSMQAYPVPARDLLNILIQLDKAVAINLLLTDMYGRTIKKLKANIQVGVNNFTMNINDLPSGQYILKAESTVKLNNQKIIISH